MTTKVKPEPVVVDDLRSLRDALDAPERARKEAEARAREAEQRTHQDGLTAYARKIVEQCKVPIAAKAAWDAAPVDVAVFRSAIGEGTPLWRASDAVNVGSWPIEDAVRVAGDVARLVEELSRPALLPATRLAQIRKTLDRAAERVEGFVPVYAAWIRMREDAVAQLAPLLKLHYALRRRWMPTEAERTLLAQQQQHLAEAAKAMPPTPSPTPRRGIPGANFDASTNTSPPARRPLLENMEDL